METFVRMPAVAGQFYPANADTLRRAIQSYTKMNGEKLDAIGCVVPHAGYMYSGHVAGAVYARLNLPDRYIILCPNHTGHGAPLAIMREGSWMTPLGEVPIDSDLAGRLQNEMPDLTDDIEAQRHEHALEVQLPFLQSMVGNFAFVPVTVGTSRLEHLIKLGIAMSKAIESRGDNVMIIASSDMNHYEADSTTRVKDRKAIDRVLALDECGLFEVVTRERVTMCGFGPTIAMLTASKSLGARKAELIRYATSGDISGDRDAVVGYAGIAVTR
jgi:MEMO1 family protein